MASNPFDRFDKPAGNPFDQFDAPAQTTSEQRRADAGQGLHFRPFGIDTGLTYPQGVGEYVSGLGRRMSEIGTLGTHEAAPEAVDAMKDSLPAQAGMITADVGTMALGGTALKAAEGVPMIGRAAATAGRALATPAGIPEAMAAQGAYGAATNNNRAEAGAWGAAGGALGQAIPKVAGAVISPELKATARALLDRGVKLTPGEMLGGAAQRIEDAATAIPIVGDAIKAAKNRSLEGFNKSVIDEALATVNKTLPKGVTAGHEAIDAAHNAISDVYDKTLTGMHVQLDVPFVQTMNKIESMVAQLPKKEQNAFQTLIKDEIDRKFGNPTSTSLGESVKEISSMLRGAAKKLGSSADFYQNTLGDAVKEVNRAVLDMVKRQHPTRGAMLDAADKAYAQLGRIKDAASRAGAKEGVFTPAQLVAAIRKYTGADRFARGQGFGQDYAEGAKEVLSQKVADSGTVTRAMVGAGTLGGLHMLDPSGLSQALMLGGAAAYTKPGTELANLLIAKRPQSARELAKAIRSLTPYSGVLGSAVGVNSSGP